jgi:predicted restriction endonuclease
MSDLPPIVSDATEWFVNQIRQMRRGVSNKRAKPHKLVMLLAVLDLAKDGLLEQNKIYFEEPLLSRFGKYFALVEQKDDWNQPAPPFFHLRSSDFWFHQVKIDRERAYSKLSTSGGGKKRIADNIEYAYLDDRAFMVVNHPIARDTVYKIILMELEMFPELLFSTKDKSMAAKSEV